MTDTFLVIAGVTLSVIAGVTRNLFDEMPDKMPGRARHDEKKDRARHDEKKDGARHDERGFSCNSPAHLTGLRQHPEAVAPCR